MRSATSWVTRAREAAPKTVRLLLWPVRPKASTGIATFTSVFPRLAEDVCRGSASRSHNALLSACRSSYNAGANPQDRNVPLIVSGARDGEHEVNNSMVETTQIAPTILKLLGLNPNAR